MELIINIFVVDHQSVHSLVKAKTE